jgi:hypothetical protein
VSAQLDDKNNNYTNVLPSNTAGKDNKLVLEKCKSGRIGQQFKYVDNTSDVTSSHSSQVSDNEDNPKSYENKSVELIPSLVEKQETYISNDNNQSEEEEINSIEDVKYIEEYPLVEDRLSRATTPTSDEDHLKSGIRDEQEGEIKTYMYIKRICSL